MPTDLNGTPTSLGIGTYNTSIDAPSGLGFNEAMAQIDALIAERMKVVGTPTDGQVPMWNDGTGQWEPKSISAGTPTIIDFTANHDLVLTDANNVIRMNLSSANNVNIQPDVAVDFPVGTSITIIQIGTGQTTISPQSGVTIQATPGTKIAAQYGAATLLKVAANTWALFGNLVP